MRDDRFGQQAHVAEGDIDIAVGGGLGERLQADADRVAGAGRYSEYRVFLVGEDPTRLCAGGFSDVGAFDADDDDLVGAVEALLYGSCDAQRRRAPPYFVQHLGGLGADAFAVTGGEDDADARDVVLDW